MIVAPDHLLEVTASARPQTGHITDSEYYTTPRQNTKHFLKNYLRPCDRRMVSKLSRAGKSSEAHLETSARTPHWSGIGRTHPLRHNSRKSSTCKILTFWTTASGMLASALRVPAMQTYQPSPSELFSYFQRWYVIFLGSAYPNTVTHTLVFGPLQNSPAPWFTQNAVERTRRRSSFLRTVRKGFTVLAILS